MKINFGFDLKKKCKMGSNNNLKYCKELYTLQDKVKSLWLQCDTNIYSTYDNFNIKIK